MIRKSSYRIVLKLNTSYLLLAIFTLFSVKAFSEEKDSLHKELASVEGVQKVEVLIAIAELADNPNVGYEFGFKALRLSDELDYHIGIVNSLIVITKFNLIEKKFSEAIKNASKALQITEEFDLKSVLIGRIHHQLSTALENIGAYSDALSHKKEQLTSRVFSSKKDSTNLFYLNGQIAELYLKSDRLDSSLVYYKKALSLSISLRLPNLEGTSYNNIALTYLELENIDSAIFYFNKSREYYLDLETNGKPNHIMIGLIEGNIAMCLQNSDPLKEKYLLNDISYSYQYEKGSHLVQAYLNYANYKLETFQYKTAELYLDSANVFVTNIHIPNQDLLLEIYHSYTLLCIHTNQSQKAEDYFLKYNTLYDSLYGKKAVNQLLNTHSSYKVSKIENELTIEKIQGEKKAIEISDLNKEKTISNLKITILIGGGILILGIAILIILKVRSDGKKAEKEKELENKLLEKELDYGSKLLTQSALGLKRKKEFSEELTERISQIENITSSEKQAIRLYISNELDIDNSLIEMEKYISEIGKDFFIRLKALHPDLSENDIKLVVLIRMQLNLKQIAIIRNITPESVKIAKNRLSKKLKLPSGQVLFEYLSEI